MWSASWARVRRKELNSYIAHPISGSGFRGNSVNRERLSVNSANEENKLMTNKGNKLMTEVATRGEIPLNWDVFVAPGIPMVTSDLPPRTTQGTWSPISSTLIYGNRDAVLVDAFITVEQADALVDWVAASGKNLTTIYVTHGHGDHFFGAGIVRERFPDTRFVATPAVIRKMRQQIAPDVVGSFYKALFPDQ